MSLSPNRIIKVKRPISRVVVVPVEKELLEEHPASTPDTAKHPEPEAVQPQVEMLQMTREEFQQELQTSFQQGLSEGHVLGFQEAEANYADIIQKLNEVLTTLDAQHEQIVRENEARLLNLLFKMVEKIIPVLAEEQKNVIENTFRNILKTFSLEGKVKVYMHPDDLAVVREMEEEIRKNYPEIQEIKLHSDESMTRGGCIVETQNSKLDASIETQVEEMITQLTREIQSGEENGVQE